MVTHCANPICGVPLRYLRFGRLFRFEVRALKNDSDSRVTRQVTHFWLCGECAPRLTLAFDPLRGVQVIPQGVIMPRGEVPSHSFQAATASGD
jgi:hypothetical protein